MLPGAPTADQSETSKVHDTRRNTTDLGTLLIVPLVILACGHMLSNLVRTLPAVAVDVMAPDLHSNSHDIASLTAAYHLAFAVCQLPIGAALDRFSVRAVAITLFIGTLAGSIFAALSSGPLSFLAAQILLGVATSGMLMCPMTLAARRLSPVKFGLWSGIILSLGNSGMLLSASPLAWVVDYFGWRAGFWIAAVLSCAIGFSVMIYVPADRPQAPKISAPLREMIEVVRLAAAPSLRGIIAIAFVSIAVVLVLRGLWAGPWLMDIKGLSRLDAGNILFLFTLALIGGPFLAGALDRKLGRRRELVAASHLSAAAILLLIAAGAPGYAIANAFGLSQMPVRYDSVLLVTLGLVISSQPLIFAMARQVVTVENTGKALSAVNLSLFLGTAVMQSATDPIAAKWGLPAVMLFMAATLAVGTVAFTYFTRTTRPGPDSFS